MKSAFKNDLFRDVKEDIEEGQREIMENEGQRPNFEEYIQQRNRVIKRMYKVDEFSPEELAETFKLSVEEVEEILAS